MDRIDNSAPAGWQQKQEKTDSQNLWSGIINLPKHKNTLTGEAQERDSHANSVGQRTSFANTNSIFIDLQKLNHHIPASPASDKTDQTSFMQESQSYEGPEELAGQASPGKNWSISANLRRLGLPWFDDYVSQYEPPSLEDTLVI